MPQESSRYFANISCEWFPCHAGADKEVFNCLFCFCPLYHVKNCGGAFIILANGVKDCSACLFPHRPENYDIILSRLGKNR